MHRRRILYVITDLKTGGVPLHLLRLALAVRERGFEPHVASLAPPGPVSEELRRRGVTVFHCDATGPADWRVFPRLSRIIGAVKPAIVHALLFHANVTARLVLAMTGPSRRPLICEIQTVEIERRWHLNVESLTHRLCRCVVGNSQAVVDHLHGRAFVPRSCLRCIPGGIDVAAIRDASPADRTAMGLPIDRPIILWVGRMDPVKGLEDLIGAFALVREAVKAHLVLVGDGDHCAHVRAAAESSDVGRHVHFLGTRSDVPSLLKLADAFAFPSYTEGMPNALLEAMAAGLPIVTTDVPGCRDLVTHESTGLLVPPHDTHALAAALACLLQDHTLAARLGRSAAAHVEAHHGFDACVDRYVALYDEVLGESVTA